jgi:subtilisin family serine protease
MIRAVTVALTLTVLLTLAFTACVPVQPESAASARQLTMTQPPEEDACLAVVNQAILGLPSNFEISSFVEANQLESHFLRVTVSDPVTSNLAPVNDEAVETAYYLLEGDEATLAAISEVVARRQLDGEPYLYGKNLVARMVEGLGHSPSQSPFGAAPSFIPTAIPGGGPLSPNHLSAQMALTTVRNSALYISLPVDTNIQVKIAVFDSTPFRVDLPLSPEIVDILPHDVLTTMTTLVKYTDIEGPARDHGIFASSLAHQLAPNAELYLYRALNEDGIGNVFSLAQQLNSFLLNEHPVHTNVDGVARSVANLSMGVSCDPASYATTYESIGTFTESIRIISDAIGSMQQQGVVMVAAAGNGGKVNIDPFYPPRPRQAFPASHDYVIGVGASDMVGHLPTCYSHQADIFLPGGEAQVNCEPAYHACPLDNVGACRQGLVGVSSASMSGLAYWAGTSFAAPLVSGLVARWLSQEVNDPLANEYAVTTITSNVTGTDVINTDDLQTKLYANYAVTSTLDEMQMPEESAQPVTKPYTYWVLR